MLDQVNQIALELHHSPQLDKYVFYMTLLQDLYRAGFRLVSQEVNMLVGHNSAGYYEGLEVVFMRVESN